MTQLPLKLSDASGVPYYRQIVDQIADLIRSGQLRPNTLLPSVRDLASQLLVSLITVRRAYSDLEAANLVVLRQGDGTYVAENVHVASRKQALAEARALLAETIAHVGRLGLDGAAIREFVAELVSDEGKGHGLQ